MQATRSVCCRVCLLGLLLIASSVVQAQDSEEVAPLTAMLEHFLAHADQGDVHARFWADELVYTSSNGTRFGKAEIMQGFTEQPDSAADAGPAVTYSAVEIRVQVYGTTAVVTFKLLGTPDNGDAPKAYFNSGTFLKRNGEWRAVLWQATAIPDGDGNP